MTNRIAANMIPAFVLLWPLTSVAADPDYSKEAAVIQNLATRVSFSSDSAREWDQVLAVRIQSEQALRQYGVLSFVYQSTNEQMTIAYVRVRKPDGSVVETPDSSIVDLATPVAAAAPTYLDLRYKQVPVKGLAVGDVLEYSVHSSQKPETRNQFWYAQYLIQNSVVLKQTVEIRVPKSKYVQVSSPNLQPERRDEGDERVYTWTHSNLEPTKPKDPNRDDDESHPPKIQLTTFKNWDEVGAWWSALASPQAAVTPAIQAKTDEITKGLSSESEKARAIYKYVALRFRYISVSLGQGRYRPHTAAEVLANQYGDCKDKHTLFAALLKASGIQAWPALVGVGMKFDETVPSPAAFNHVITVLPGRDKTWLDTTAEVAPFGMLTQAVRDQTALVVSAGQSSYLWKTPGDPPFAISNRLEVKSSLVADGTLQAHFHAALGGDAAIGMRSGFRQLAPAQWQAFAQKLSEIMGFAGEVSGVEIENLEDLDKPFQYSYDYHRKDYSDWKEHQITAPLPMLGFGPGEEAEKPKEPFWSGEPGTTLYTASIELPKGFELQAPAAVNVTSAFADYSASYSLKGGILSCERKLTIKQSKVALEEWAEYQKFSKDLRTDQTTFIALSETGKGESARAQTDSEEQSDNNPEAQQLLQRASTAVQSGNLNEARDLLAQAERVNPKQPNLWTMRAFLDMGSGQTEQAIAECRKEIQLHPNEIPAYGMLTSLLAHSGRRDEAIEAWRMAVTANPDNDVAASALATLLLAAKRYAEVPAALEKRLAAEPHNLDLRWLRIQALLKSGEKERGLAEAKALAGDNSEPLNLNNLAWFLAETGTAIDTAETWAQSAVEQAEQNCAAATVASFSQKDAGYLNFLGATWDTIGWVHFERNELGKAKSYVEAAWLLTEKADVGDHLGQIYEKMGDHTEAVHMWRLALAAQADNESAKEHLRNAGASVSDANEHRPLKPGVIPAAEELGVIRTIKIPSLPKQTGSGEFLILISHAGIEDVRDLGAPQTLKGAAEALKATNFKFPFPDNGPEKIIRRGILSCSQYTHPSCQFTMLLPSTTRSPQPADLNAGNAAPR